MLRLDPTSSVSLIKMKFANILRGISRQQLIVVPMVEMVPSVT